MEQKNTLEIELINGDFSADDTRDLLLNIIANKIQYHAVKSIENWERNNLSDKKSNQRIEELQKSRVEILSMLNQSMENDSRFRIHAIIELEKVD
jgi:hypothetical protein